MNLTFSQYQDTEVSHLTVDDAVVDALEGDNLALQNMSGNKYTQVTSVPVYHVLHEGWCCGKHANAGGAALRCYNFAFSP